MRLPTGWRSLYILWSLLGNLDVKGGLLINKNKPIKRVQNPPNNAQNIEKIGSKEFPLFDKLIGQPQFTKLPQAILESDPYPIKGLINLGSWMSVNYPNSQLYRKALKSLDFFVTCDRFMTDDSYFADVILPATTYYEEDRYAIYPDHIEIKEKLVEPLGNFLPNIFIFSSSLKNFNLLSLRTDISYNTKGRPNGVLLQTSLQLVFQDQLSSYQ